MVLIIKIILFVSLFCIFHSYILFPLIVRIAASGKTLKRNKLPEKLPFVSVIFAAYNEEKVIFQKIESTLAASYPSENFEIIIGSDGSIDKTDEIIKGFQLKNKNIVFKRFEGRCGKSFILNELVKIAQGEIYILTDANILFSTELIANLVSHFNDSSIGLVGANIKNSGMRKDGISFQEESYIKRENSIKYHEGLAWGTMMGAFGACYAIRRELFTPIRRNFFMEDFYLSMFVLSQKRKTINDLIAVAYEDVSNNISEEFKRKTRISIGNFQNLSVYWYVIFPFWKPVGFCFLSHKVLRWLGPLFLLLSFISTAFLLNEHIFYKILFALQAFGFISPVIDLGLKKLNTHNFALRLVAYFYMMNFALALGIIKFASGITTSAWSPTARNIE